MDVEAQMKGHGEAKMPLKKRAAHELREFCVVAAYLLICFMALAYLKATILHAHGIPFAPFSLAIVKALICAKFVLILNVFHAGDRFKTRALIWPTLYKSLIFLVLLVILNMIEEVLVGLAHHRSVADSLAEVGGGTFPQLIATSVVGFLILVPFFAFRTLGEVVGEQNLVRVFLSPRHKADKA
jgi:hypothetical protein